MDKSEWKGSRAKEKTTLPTLEAPKIVGASDDTWSDSSSSDMICAQLFRDDELEVGDVLVEREEDAVVSNKEVIVKLFDLLGIDKGLLERVPKDGFAPDKVDVDKKCRNFFRTKKIVTSVVKRLCELLCPGHEQFLLNTTSPKETIIICTTKLEKNLQKLILLGDSKTRAT